MEVLSLIVPLLNFAMVFIVIPLYRTIKSLEAQNTKLIAITEDQQKQIKNQQIEIELLTAIVFESSDPEVLRKHLLKRANHATK